MYTRNNSAVYDSIVVCVCTWNMLCYAIVTSVSWFEEAKYILEKRLLGLLQYLLCLSGIERYTSLYIVGDLRVPLLEFLYFILPGL